MNAVAKTNVAESESGAGMDVGMRADIGAPSDRRRVIIRPVERKDREPARQLLKRFHAMTIFAHFPFDDEKFDRHAERILKRPRDALCLVAEFEGDIVGLTWTSVGDYILSSQGQLATCHIIAIDQERLGNTMGGMIRRASTFLRLLKSIKTWSKTKGAEQLLVHVTTGFKEGGFDPKAANRLLEKIGAVSIGGGYVV